MMLNRAQGGRASVANMPVRSTKRIEPFTIHVATDFSPVPGGRHPRNGPFSGEEFRNQKLLPALLNVPEIYSKVVVDLDGADTYIGSFLEEAFGGLFRTAFRNKSFSEIEKILEIKGTGEFEFFRDLAVDYMRKQDSKNKSHK